LAESSDMSYQESKGCCCALSGYSPGAIFSDAYYRTQPNPDINHEELVPFWHAVWSQ